MKSRKPLRTRKPWQQKIVTYKPAAAENDRRSSNGPHPLEQAKFEIVARSGGMCEATTDWCQPGVHRGYHAHHVKPRSQGVDHSAANLLYVCSDAHSYIHGHPKESYAKGWLVHADRIAEPGIGGSFFKAGMLDDDA